MSETKQKAVTANGFGDSCCNSIRRKPVNVDVDVVGVGCVMQESIMHSSSPTIPPPPPIITTPTSPSSPCKKKLKNNKIIINTIMTLPTTDRAMMLHEECPPQQNNNKEGKEQETIPLSSVSSMNTNTTGTTRRCCDCYYDGERYRRPLLFLQRVQRLPIPRFQRLRLISLRLGVLRWLLLILLLLLLSLLLLFNNAVFFRHLHFAGSSSRTSRNNNNNVIISYQGSSSSSSSAGVDLMRRSTTFARTRAANHAQTMKLSPPVQKKQSLPPPPQQQQQRKRPESLSPPQSSSSSYPIVKLNDDDDEDSNNAEDEDSSISSSRTSTNTVHAAEALVCRKSVINFVINATDAKDECEGLKRAFDTTCSNSNSKNDDVDNNDSDEEEEKHQEEDNNNKSADTNTGHHHRSLIHQSHRQQRPHSFGEKVRHSDRIRWFVYQHMRGLRRVTQSMTSFTMEYVARPILYSVCENSVLMFFFPFFLSSISSDDDDDDASLLATTRTTTTIPAAPAWFTAEEYVLMAYEETNGPVEWLVENDFVDHAYLSTLKQWALLLFEEEEEIEEYDHDSYYDYYYDSQRIDFHRPRRRLRQVRGNRTKSTRVIDHDRTDSQASQSTTIARLEATNNTSLSSASDDPSTSSSSSSVVVPKIPVSLDLPTTHEHVSDKMVSETLLLTQGDEIIEKAQNESLAKTMQTSSSNSSNINEKNADNDDDDHPNPNQEAVEDAAASAKAVADTHAAVAALLNDPTSIEARKCCASILSVYHENCSTGDQEVLSDRRLIFMVFVMAMCGIVKSLIRHHKILWLPEAAGCILVGVLSGYVLMNFPHHDISFDGNWFLRIMVPPIVFEAALSIDKRSFNRHIVPIVIFSVVGTLISTVVTAFVLHRGTTALSRWCTPIPTVEALTFGALISSIDPIAVLSVLSNMGMSDTDTIYVLIFGESLLNDGVSIVLFQTLVHFLDDNLVIDSAAIWAATVHFLVVAVGSLLVGAASGTMSTVYYWLFHGCHTPMVEVLMFMCWAMIPYYVCDGIEWSGIVAVVANGFIMDLYIVGQVGTSSDEYQQQQPMHQQQQQLTENDLDNDYIIHQPPVKEPNIKEGGGRLQRRRIFSQFGHLSVEARTHIGFVTEILATALETAIFAYLGIFLFSHRYHWNVFHTVIAIFACCFGRAVMIPSLSFIANWITRIQQSRWLLSSCRRVSMAAMKKSSSSPNSGTSSNGVDMLGCGGGNSGEINPPPLPGVMIDRRMQLILWFAGLRGAMSFALVEHVPLYDSVSGEGSRFKPELKAMTSACILFTVFILGGYTYYMMEKLGLIHNGSSSNIHRRAHSYEMTSLILGKADSGDDEDEKKVETVVTLSCSSSSSLSASALRREAPSPLSSSSSGRQIAFRRQRHHHHHTSLSDVGSPSRDDSGAASI